VRSKWLDWRPIGGGFVGFDGSGTGKISIIQASHPLDDGSRTTIIGNPPKAEPTKPTKPSIAGSTSGEFSIEQAQSNELAPCGSPQCAGCYDVGDGRKTHPPRCGKAFMRWRAWMEGKGPETMKQETTRSLVSIGRHKRHCTVCGHEKCAEIEADFIGWKSPAAIAEEYDLADRSSVYRHAHALGLFEKRKRNVKQHWSASLRKRERWRSQHRQL
jgi:hypothetical protein